MSIMTIKQRASFSWHRDYKKLVQSTRKAIQRGEHDEMRGGSALHLVLADTGAFWSLLLCYYCDPACACRGSEKCEEWLVKINTNVDDG